MNKQELFNKAVRGLRAQGKKSVNKYDDCVYRGKEGTKCAIGFLIPDEKYSCSLEGNAAFTMKVCHAVGVDNSLDNMNFLGQMQSYLHDNIPEFSFKETFESRVEEFAKQLGLEVPND